MPTYQYACTSCGERLEVVQKFTDDPLTECPACNGTLRKVFSAVGVVFKGSGFYKTDSRTTKKPAAAGSAQSDKAASEKAESGKTDSGKPDSGKADGAKSGTSGSDSASSGSSTTAAKPGTGSGDRVA